eukprot:CAMPEP_0170957602 /NCGR_PEP_ID=MMETSP0735-20130129/34938_1 /TAXON_ID=186038 /ORGANISM="Fragilariopsis kerguelensis, Strain L26-C5" /LENGTH=42 /DNA_ID= /DNA_START= /DNA_END= /DNA_ORIENTATION=
MEGSSMERIKCFSLVPEHDTSKRIDSSSNNDSGAKLSHNTIE